MELAFKWVVANYDGIIKWLTLILASSGWIKVWYDHLGNKPKISGNILCIIEGQFRLYGEARTSYMFYPYLINLRKNSVHVLDYELHVKPSRFSRWEILDRSFGIEKAVGLDFTAKDGESIGFNKLAENMIYKKGLPVEQGWPLHGWLHFLGDIKHRGRTMHKYKLTCIDAYGNKHFISIPGDKKFNPLLLMEVADMTLPISMLSNAEAGTKS